jgi:hypothetical protein
MSPISLDFREAKMRLPKDRQATIGKLVPEVGKIQIGLSKGSSSCTVYFYTKIRPLNPAGASYQPQYGH